MIGDRKSKRGRERTNRRQTKLQRGIHKEPRGRAGCSTADLRLLRINGKSAVLPFVVEHQNLPDEKKLTHQRQKSTTTMTTMSTKVEQLYRNIEKDAASTARVFLST